MGDLNSGEINIAAGESTILYLLPEVIKQFADAYPGVRLKLHNVTGRDGMAMLRADQADFAVGSMLEVPEDIDYRPIFDFKTMLITPLDHPLAGKRAANIKLEDISPHGLILPPRHLATWRRVEMIFGQHKVNYTVTLEAGGWEVIKKYVEMGLGIAIVTAICLKGDEKIAKIPLDRFFPNRSYGVVMRKRKYLSPPARQFLEMMAPDFSGQLEKSVGEYTHDNQNGRRTSGQFKNFVYNFASSSSGLAGALTAYEFLFQATGNGRACGGFGLYPGCPGACSDNRCLLRFQLQDSAAGRPLR